MEGIRPYKIHVPESLLEETKTKLRYARIDDGMMSVEWNDLEVEHLAFKEVVEFWRDKYDWRSFEAHLNTFNHFTTDIAVNGFEHLDIYFLHHRSSKPDAIPLIFVHGWPGPFLEALKIIPLLTEPTDGRQAFHVVAPCLPGYGFSEYSKKAGFGLEQHAECFASLMEKLGYPNYVCQFLRFARGQYSEQEQKNLERTKWFATMERGYQRIQETKPVTLGQTQGMDGQLPLDTGGNHPLGLIHYQGSPSAAMQVYKEAEAVLNGDSSSMLARNISQPVGGSLFPNELWLYPHDWVSEACNIKFWRQHDVAWEQPEILVTDVADFFGETGPVFGAIESNNTKLI
ncbi:Alpha/Beta hydrolase protein [Penicillium canescens]|uniref:Alpha/Beta hydrolase protein n=1 Tax=Penicillium canescens TaxID=5083 RepID=A0AAD6NEJ7_PENCN|nr:Alpha/Beta hydrolase protein [Penicillium canescens]KAJ6033228.1 Alpha/Beta hydrolase protein [Penicillium canescens]KAJ6057581.1 Alpha/Beta hydrolase protein [Penicillium canescens]KAJ6058897.1 Alpha/Beta hydrolase protein [Penicillium canescens]